MKRICSILTALISLMLLLFLSGCQKSNQSTQQSYQPKVTRIAVELAAVQPDELNTIAEFTGTLLPRRLTHVMAEVEGVVSEIPQVGVRIQGTANGRSYDEQLGILPGQTVKKGDVLLSLDPRRYEASLAIAVAKLKTAEAELQDLQAWSRPEEVSRLQAMKNDAEARYKGAITELNRQNRLRASNAVSQSELEQARMSHDSAEAILESTIAELDKSKTGPTAPEIAIKEALVEEMEAGVEQQKLLLEKTVLRAPYDGVVTSFNVEVGNIVSPATGPLVELIDNRFLVAEVGVPETYLRQISIYDRGQVFATGAKDPAPGVVVGINEKVEPETRTFKLRVAIDNQVAKLKAGQFAKIRIPLSASQETETLTIPNKAIVFVDGQPHVYVYQSGRAVRTEIKLGLGDDRKTEILDGLSNGQQVIVDDPNLLTDGSEVEIRG